MLPPTGRSPNATPGAAAGAPARPWRGPPRPPSSSPAASHGDRRGADARSSAGWPGSGQRTWRSGRPAPDAWVRPNGVSEVARGCGVSRGAGAGGGLARRTPPGGPTGGHHAPQPARGTRAAEAEPNASGRTSRAIGSPARCATAEIGPPATLCATGAGSCGSSARGCSIRSWATVCDVVAGDRRCRRSPSPVLVGAGGRRFRGGRAAVARRPRGARAANARAQNLRRRAPAPAAVKRTVHGGDISRGRHQP